MRFTFLVSIAVIAVLISAGCGGRHTTGIYAPPLPEDDSTYSQQAQPVHLPNDPVYIPGSGGGNVNSIPKLVRHPDVKAFFTEWQPTMKARVLDPVVDLYTKLQIVDRNHGKWSRLDGLGLELFEVNGVELQPELTRVSDGFVVHLNGYTCQEPGRQTVTAILSDDDGRRFIKTWEFEFDPEPPHYSGIQQKFGLDASGTQWFVGYTVQFDDELPDEFIDQLTTADNWSLTKRTTGETIPIDRAETDEYCTNVINLYVDESCIEEMPLVSINRENLRTFEAETDFFSGELPTYNFKGASRSVSWANDECMDPEKECPYPLCWEELLDPLQAPWWVEDPEACEECECGADICYQRPGNCQCCAPGIYAELGRCHCPSYYLWRIECETKDGIPPQITSEDPKVDDHWFLPQVGDGCPKEDERETSDCPPHAFTVPLGYEVPPGATQLVAVGGLYGGATVLDWHFDNTETQATYLVDIGMWCPCVDENGDPCEDANGNTHPTWLSGGTISVVAGDITNPTVEIGLVTVDQLVAEMGEAMSAGARWEAYKHNKDKPWFPATPQDLDESCDLILRINLEDQCLDLTPKLIPPDDYLLPVDYLWALPKNLFENPGQYPAFLSDPFNWQLRADMTGRSLYICDWTDYSPCNEMEGSATQRLTCYYVWDNEKIPSDFAVEYTVGGPNGGQVETSAWDCQRYFTYPKKDWNFLTQVLQGYNWTTGCYIEETELNEWDTPEPTLYRRADYGEFTLVDGDEFITITFTDKNGVEMQGEEEILPVEGVLVETTQELIDKGVPFAVYYNWDVDTSGPYCDLAEPPTLPTDAPPGKDPQNYVGKPRLRLAGTDAQGAPFERFDDFQREASGTEGVNCRRVRSGVSCWPCVKTETVTSSSVVASPACAENFADLYNINANFVFPVMHRLEVSPPEGFIVYGNSGPPCSSANNKVMRNPMVAGDSSCSNTSWGPCKCYNCGKESGPAFAAAHIKICGVPKKIEVYIVGGSNYKTVEEVYPNHNVGNAIDADDERFFYGPVTKWENCINPYSIVPWIEGTELWYPPVCLEEIDDDDVEMSEEVVESLLHCNVADLADGIDNIRNTKFTPFTFGHYEVKVDPHPMELKQPYGEFKRYFAVGIDGRQWLLDEGLEVFESFAEVSMDPFAYRQWKNYNIGQGTVGGPPNSLSVEVSDSGDPNDVINVFDYRRGIGAEPVDPTQANVYPVDGGTWMYPPGVYEYMVAVTFEDDVTLCESLGSICISYGGQLINGIAADESEYNSSILIPCYGTYNTTRAGYNEPGDLIETWLFGHHVVNDSPGPGLPVDPNLPKWVTGYTATEFSSHVEVLGHNKNWDFRGDMKLIDPVDPDGFCANKHGTDQRLEYGRRHFYDGTIYGIGYLIPIRKDFVVISECRGYQSLRRDLGRSDGYAWPYESALAWKGYYQFNKGTEWMKLFYTELFKRNDPTLTECYEYAKNEVAIDAEGNDDYEDTDERHAPSIHPTLLGNKNKRLSGFERTDR